MDRRSWIASRLGKTMSTFLEFLVRMASHLGITISVDELKKNCKDEDELVAKILHEISKYFYQRHKNLEKEYVSEFHKYWKEHHEDVLNPEIDRDVCRKVAEVLENIYKNNKIKVQLDTRGLKPEEIANVRFFTAIQDFKIDINAKGNPFEFYKNNPAVFDAAKILKNEALITKLLDFLGASSQTDKRKKWAKQAAKLLVDEYDGSAFNILKKNEYDPVKIRQKLGDVVGYGMSKKKCDMFMRDMVDLGVWQYKKNIDQIDVMSDMNTMRIALRTGILKFRIPLLASYLDVYCYQYELVVRKTVEAWRVVWEEWGGISNNHRPPTPASIDYFIFQLGRLVCKKSSRKCPPGEKIKEKWLERQNIQDKLLIKDGFCLFQDICQSERKILHPPKSISQKQATGWDSGKTDEGGGLGISS
jgi:RNase P subunit RPR2